MQRFDMRLVACTVACAAVAAASAGPVQQLAKHLVASAASGTQLTKHLVAGTTCLDGSPAGYYAAASPSNTSTQWVIYFEGGGACYSLASCAARAKTALGSSTAWPPTFSQDDNVLSFDAAVNPTFFDAHKVYIPYCTGDGNGGTRSAPLNASWPFFFSGHKNVVAIVRELAVAHFGGGGAAGGGAAARVLVTGSSAGGFGTLLNADFIADALGAAAVVTAAPQGGWFFPPVSFFPVWAAGGSTPVWATLSFVAELWATFASPECVAAHNASFCTSADNYARYVRTPLFIAENLVDSNQIFSELLAPPASPRLPAFEAVYHTAMRSSLRAAVASRPDWAVWAPACVAHTENLRFYDQAVANGTVVADVTFRDALTAWWSGAAGTPRVLMDDCADPLPCNPTCPK